MIIDTSKILSNKWLRYGLILTIGIAIGAIFYPSKTIDRELEKTYESKIEELKKEKKSIISDFRSKVRKVKSEKKEYRRETSKRLSKLKREKTKLERRVRERKLKIVKPDGTTVEKTFRESETEKITSVLTKVRKEFDEKVSSIRKKWMRIHRDRVSKIKSKYESKIKSKESTIKSLRKTEHISVNDRSFAVSAGIATGNSYYSGVSYDLFGPVFIDSHVQSSKTFSDIDAGIGVGLRF